ncbi:hypothetical protein SFA35_07330 [Pseudomonas sp. HR96]|uniref:hypothetical protein n=1 Tax=Pseudomonas sp. HR96 TaxID=1027966 RepID=UPI002A7626CC|nr:hypothetical protein [Pseudomonas sp. HR96]WPP01162.1 hypothetical protein SFA35_07330 [Pseudomonas sp. HR96]
MAIQKTKLRDIVKDPALVQKITQSFSDLRADFDLSLEASAEKITELAETHVEIKDHLNKLISHTGSSSGVIQGLRGTGKTHLFLLARHNINQDIFENGNLTIYLNSKKLTTPEGCTQEIFNRLFSSFILTGISEHLQKILVIASKQGFWNRLLDKATPQSIGKRLAETIEILLKSQDALLSGTRIIENYEAGEQKINTQLKDLIEAFEEMSAQIGLSTASFGLSAKKKSVAERNITKDEATKFISYLDISHVSEIIKKIISTLQIKSITFYIDEWEKLYYEGSSQKYLATYINKIIDNPIYFWIAYFPYRGNLHPLSIGNDLQHLIDLDESLIYETDQQSCIKYFQDFIDKRLQHHLHRPDISNSVLINSKKNFELLIMGSMGNPRDFGTILVHAWNEFVTYRNRPLKRGGAYQYVSAVMIKDAIKSDGEKKLLNIQARSNAMSAWRHLEDFAIKNKTSHIAVEESAENHSALAEDDFSELIYQRLLHKRTDRISAKDTNISNKLSIYALSYSCTYDHHQKDKKFQFITKYEDIHNRVRRYIYNPCTLIKQRKLREGVMFPCPTCDFEITQTMKFAWEKNMCPACGNSITKDKISEKPVV